jgi:hypothetical protein
MELSWEKRDKWEPYAKLIFHIVQLHVSLLIHDSVSHSDKSHMTNNAQCTYKS